MVGVDTRPVQGFLTINTHSQASMNNFGDKAESFNYELIKAKNGKEDAALNSTDDVKLVTSGAAVAKTAEGNGIVGKSPKPTIGTVGSIISSMTQGASNMFHPFSSPSLFNPFSEPSHDEHDDHDHYYGPPGQHKADEPEGNDGKNEEIEEESGSGFYTFIRPLTPAGISESISTMLKPLSAISGQAQGNISSLSRNSVSGYFANFIYVPFLQNFLPFSFCLAKVHDIKPLEVKGGIFLNLLTMESSNH